MNRRTFLRGASAALALPTLEAMLNGNGTAYAQGAPLPKRFVVWFWGNGNEPGAWTPAVTGAGWSPTASQAALLPLKADVTLVSGMKLPVRKVNNPHVEGVVGLLAGGNPLLHPSYTGVEGDWNFMTVPGPSADQVVASAIGSTTAFRSLELGVTPVHGSTGPGQAISHISHSAPYTPNPGNLDPAAVFQRLFGNGLPNPQAPDAPLKRVRASILDAVKADAADLRRRLGVNDQRRLDAHLDGVRALEQRINAMPAPPPTACRLPSTPMPGPGVAERAQVMGELAVMALACDLTRVVTLQLSSPASHNRFDAYQTELSCGGEPKSFHEYEHCAGYDAPVRAVLKYFVDQYAAFVSQVKAVPEGAGTLLDNACVLGCSELSGGWDHQHVNMPLVVAGRAGGALSPGRHVAALDENPARLLLALMQAVGAPVTSWGRDQFETSSPLGGV